MKQILRYPFLLLLILSLLAVTPYAWKQIGILPGEPAIGTEVPEEPELSDVPKEPDAPVEIAPEEPDLPAEPEHSEPEAPAAPEDSSPEMPEPPELPPEEPLPEEPVPPEEIFRNSLFIGDSRTVGIHEYAGIDEADFFADTGMSVYNVFKKALRVGSDQKYTLRALLELRNYDRIFVMLGINELGYNFGKTAEKYGELIDVLQEMQPEAQIIVQCNLHVSRKRSDTDKLYNNKNINRLNELIAGMAAEKQVALVNPNAYFDDENAALRADLTFDEVHLYGRYYADWANWLRENVPQ